jgi:hypothetical protein
MLSRIYFDACCFIELAKGKFGKSLHNDGAYIWYLEALLRASKAKKIEVCTSMMSVVECTTADGDMSADVQSLFIGLLTSGKSGVLLLQSDIWVAEQARDLRWKHDINLKCPDSIHVASAIDAGCAEFITMDGVGGSKKSILMSAKPLAALNISVVAPDQTKLIPDEFRQHSISYQEGAVGHESRQDA